MDTKIVALRRERLREWLQTHAVPPREKSYFSQLKTTGSFGEKAARRLEEKYGMGHMYLDTPGVSGGVAAAPAEKEVSVKIVSQDATELVRTSMAMLARYWALDEVGRRDVDKYLSLVEDRGAVAAPEKTRTDELLEKRSAIARHVEFEIDPPLQEVERGARHVTNKK